MARLDLLAAEFTVVDLEEIWVVPASRPAILAPPSADERRWWPSCFDDVIVAVCGSERSNFREIQASIMSGAIVNYSPHQTNKTNLMESRFFMTEAQVLEISPDERHIFDTSAHHSCHASFPGIDWQSLWQFENTTSLPVLFSSCIHLVIRSLAGSVA